jgi:hypothetical protein
MRYCENRRAVGDVAEKAFADHSEVTFIRMATPEEDKTHFDMVVDLGFGEIKTDVKSFNPDRAHTDIAYLELVNNYGLLGWAVDDRVKDRFVTWEHSSIWITVSLDEIRRIVNSGSYRASNYKYGAVLMKVPFSHLIDVSVSIIDKEQ